MDRNFELKVNLSPEINPSEIRAAIKQATAMMLDQIDRFVDEGIKHNHVCYLPQRITDQFEARAKLTTTP